MKSGVWLLVVAEESRSRSPRMEWDVCTEVWEGLGWWRDGAGFPKCICSAMLRVGLTGVTAEVFRECV